MSEARKAFVWTSRAWYAKSALRRDTVDEINVGMYYPDGGCDYEFILQWTNIGMQIRVFYDAFIAFKDFAEMFSALPEMYPFNPSPEAVVDMLLELGYVDDTPTKNPHGPHACETVCSRCKKNTCTSDAHPGICCACRSKELDAREAKPCAGESR